MLEIAAMKTFDVLEAGESRKIECVGDRIVRGSPELQVRQRLFKIQLRNLLAGLIRERIGPAAIRAVEPKIDRCHRRGRIDRERLKARPRGTEILAWRETRICRAIGPKPQA